MDFLTEHYITSVSCPEILVSENHTSLMHVIGLLLYVPHLLTDLTKIGYSAPSLNSTEKVRVCENCCNRSHTVYKGTNDVVSRLSKFNVLFGYNSLNKMHRKLHRVVVSFVKIGLVKTLLCLTAGLNLCLVFPRILSDFMYNAVQVV